MNDLPEPKRHGPTALAGVVIALVLILVGAGLALREFLAAERPAQSTGIEAVADAAKRAINRFVSEMHEAEQKPLPRPPSSAPAAPPAPSAGGTVDPQRQFPAITAPAPPHTVNVPVRGNWTYDVAFGPSWRKEGQLFYQTEPAAQGKTGAKMSWTFNDGQTSTWFLGIVEAGHPTHGNTRFPGFFMHAVYFPAVFVPESRLQWAFPWQGGNAGTQAARERRYDMKVAGWERVEVPAGVFDAVRLDGTLRYVEGEATQLEVRYTLWYSARARQVVRVLWIGHTPDESHAEMLAELASYAAQ
mgnify:FL=1